MQTRWRIQLLGGLGADSEAQRLTHFRTRKVGLLLACLAYDLHREHRREELIERLWPEEPLATGRDGLRASLYALRRQLEPPGTPAGAVLQADRLHARLNPEAVTTDVAAFEAALRGAREAGEESEQARHLARAVESYGGELLPGYYEDWVLQERQWLAERYFQALGELLARLEKAGASEQALEYARRGVRADPLREEAHRDLIRLLAAAGRPEAALRQYQELERRLARDLGDEPSAGVRALAATLRQQLSLAPIPGATAPAPAPAPSAPVSSVPLPLDRFFGRRSELAWLLALLRPLTGEATGDEERVEESVAPRLITLTGPGGSGKTRLALEVARRLQPRSQVPIWFVPLQGLTPSAAPGADATPMRPPILEEVRDALRLPRSPGAEPLEQLVAALTQQPALLILDNFEHLVEGGAPLVELLLQRIPTLTILVASRRSLNLPGEQEFPVRPLPVPVESGKLRVESPAKAGTSDLSTLNSQLSTLTCCPSVALFLDRARAARPDFQLTPDNAADVARLCARLEGIPLAIELAAGRAGVLTPGQILERLCHPFALLVSRRSGVEERHRSLRATVDWSFQLLPTELQQFFTCLSIFRGGWTLAAAAEVCEAAEALDYLEQLRECSLIVVDEAGGEMRFRLLETLREYGAERLADDEQEALARRHAAFFLALAERAELRVNSRERYSCLAHLEQEMDNFRAALSWCLQAVDSGQWLMDSPEVPGPKTTSPLSELPTIHHPPTTAVEIGLRLASALVDFWQYSGHAGEGRDWLARFLKYTDGMERSAPRAKAVGAAGLLTAAQYEEANSIRLLEESVALWRELGDLTCLPRLLYVLGRAKVYSADLDGARPLLEEAVALLRERADRWDLADAIGTLALLALFERDRVRARELFEEGRLLSMEVGAREILSGTVYRLGDIAEQEGRLEEARDLYEQSMAATHGLPAADDTCPLRALGRVARLQGDYAAARARLEECLALRQRLGHLAYLPQALFQLADLVRLQGDFATARSLAEQSLATARARAEHPGFEAQALRLLGRVAYEQGDLQHAGKLLEEARSHAPGSLLVLADLAETLAGLGEHDEAQAIFEERLPSLRSDENHLGLSDLLRRRGRVELRQREWHQAAASYQESLSLLQERSVREGVPECLEGLAEAVVALWVDPSGQPRRVESGKLRVERSDRPAFAGLSTLNSQLSTGTGSEADPPPLRFRCVPEARLAARWLGAAERLRETMGAPRSPIYRSDHERTVACLRSMLGERELAAAWGEGKAMPPEESVAEAVEAHLCDSCTTGARREERAPAASPEGTRRV